MDSISDSFANHLRLFSQGEGAPPGVLVPDAARNLLPAFETATGWILGFEESKASFQRRREFALGGGSAEGVFFIDDLSADIGPERRPIDRRASENLAESLNGVFRELNQVRQDYRAAQAELATHCSWQVRPKFRERIDNFLQTILRTALQLTGFESAGLSLLNEDSHTLVLRAVAGPHFESQLGVYRELRDCRGDLEALSGSLVTVHRKADVVSWQAPVAARSAVCLPVSSLDNLLGTLWFVSDRRKLVSDQQCLLLEIIAGRIAAELERGGLLGRLQRVLDESQTLYLGAGEQWVGQQDPRPPFDGWEIQTGEPNFADGHDHEHLALWRVSSEEGLAVLVGDFTGSDAWDQQAYARTVFEILLWVDGNPVKWLEVIREALARRFGQSSARSLLGVHVDPLTGETRLASQGEFQVGVSGIRLPLADYHWFSGAATAVVPRFLARNSALAIRQNIQDGEEFLLKICRQPR